MKKLFIIIAVVLIGAYANVYAASVDLIVSPTTVKAGENYTVTVKVHDATAWNVHAEASGATEACVIAKPGFHFDLSVELEEYSVTCKAKNEGTITVALTGDVTGTNSLDITDLNDTKTITVTANDEVDPEPDPTPTPTPTPTPNTNQKNTIKISVPLTGDDVIKGTPDEETNEFVNKYPVYVTQTVENEIKSISITVGNKANTVKEISFEEVSPYKLTKDGDKATFAIDAGQTGKSDKKVLVGYVVVRLTGATETPFTISNKKVNGAKTGAAFNTLAIALGLATVGVISVYVAKKRRMI